MNVWMSRALAALLGLAALSAAAQKITEEDAAKIWADAKAAAQSGPSSIALSNQGRLALPADYVFVPQPHAAKVLNAMGNPGSDPRLQGLVFPNQRGGWFMTIRYEDSGYVKDDDAKDWNADDLLKSYREGTEAMNEERGKMGVPGLEIIGWAEKPGYDSATHRLAWAMSSREKGAPAGEPQGVNYNTYALGREGYFSLNLVTDLKDLPAHKPAAHTMLDALQFNEGKRYADFNSGTDKVAAYGLAALVVGAAAKKLGFFALAAVFLAKFAKVIFIAALALGGGAFNWMRKRKQAQAVAVETPPAQPGPPSA
jgi:uncharacterized membrane-anchored protein